jgi:hypothetical protein
VEIQGAEMLNLIGDLCWLRFLNSIDVGAGVQRQRLALFIGHN